MHHVPLAFQQVCGCSNETNEKGDGMMEVRFLYADDLVLYIKLKENLKVMVGHFVEVCK